MVYFHGGGAFHGLQFARPWTEKFRVICPYHPGFGESADDPRITGSRELVMHYLDVFDELGLGKVHLAGASMGGRLAAEFAASHNDRLKSLILPRRGAWTCPSTRPPISPPWARPTSSPPSPTTWPSWRRSSPPAVPEKVFGAARAREGQSAGRIMMSPSTLEHWMHRITVPVLLVWARRTRCCRWAG